MIRLASALALALPLLSACGLMGDLERPPPLWGNPPLDGPTDPRVIAQEEEARRAEEAARAADAQAPVPPPPEEPQQ